MLKPKVLHEVLKQANSSGVRSAVLLNREGALLASAGDDVNVLSAIFANIWTCYEKGGNLDYLLTDCEEGLVIMTKVTETLVLLLLGDKQAQPGMLKAKAKVLRDYLEQPLKELLD